MKGVTSASRRLSGGRPALRIHSPEISGYSETVTSSPKDAVSRTVPGLCADCLHARRIVSERGSVFVLCQLALTDSGFKKYPRLPVLSCTGYERKAQLSV
jgi:hypothetical protein